MSSCSEYVNKKTHEEAIGMLILKRGRYPRGMEFATIFADGAAYVATLDLKATDYRVLFALISTLTWQNFIRVTQKKLAVQLGLAPPNVSASIKRLIRYGLIAKQPDPLDDERLLLRLNLSFAWRGRPKAWTDAVHAGEAMAFAPIPIRIGNGKKTRKTAAAQKPAAGRVTDADADAANSDDDELRAA